MKKLVVSWAVVLVALILTVILVWWVAATGELGGLRNAIDHTINDESFALVSRQALMAIGLGLGWCWGGLWFALWLVKRKYG